MPRGYTPRSGRLTDFTGNRRILPRDVYQAPPPWPLPGEPTVREAQLWESVWKKPQAIIWAEDDLADDVALYVRKKAEAEAPKSSSASVDSVQKLADHLLLTVASMTRAGIAIAPPQDQSAATHASGQGQTRDILNGRTRSSAKDEFTQVNNGRTRSSAKDRFNVIIPPRVTPANDDPASFRRDQGPHQPPPQSPRHPPHQGRGCRRPPRR